MNDVDRWFAPVVAVDTQAVGSPDHGDRVDTNCDLSKERPDFVKIRKTVRRETVKLYLTDPKLIFGLARCDGFGPRLEILSGSRRFRVMTCERSRTLLTHLPAFERRATFLTTASDRIE